MKKQYIAMIQQNGGDYYGWIKFHAHQWARKNETTLLIDGYEMEFDEEINDPEEIE